ncbi:MAG: peptidoglycan-binding protein, partial [Hylemonella sp.]
SAVVNAAQNQVVVINRGQRDGLESGHVLAILKDGRQLVDKTDPNRPQLKLPDERNGLLMVFLTFDKLSYGLVLDITDGVKVGDRLATPR